MRDEVIMTCPQCAIKHLSAALAYLADGADFNGADPSVYAARALINLVEYAEGYESHRDLAAGLLVMAEERAIAYGTGEVAVACRTVRLGLSERTMGASEAIRTLKTVVEDSDIYVAHMAEAARELPDLEVETIAAIDGKADRAKAIAAEIARIKETYFPEETQERKGGESDMACKGKKVAKAAPKAAKAAPKAAAKKAACKGGKTCKKCGK